jgi:hypothetical protein
MNNSTRTVGVAIVLVATLLVAALPAAAKQPERTDFVARAYICQMGPSAREWYTDDGTVWHFRNMRYQGPVISDEPRLAGMSYCQAGQDLDQSTGNGRSWGTCVIDTEQGTWHTVYKTVYDAWVVSGQMTGHGVDGLQGQFMVWEGALLLPPYPDVSPCGPDVPVSMAFQAIGYILDREED